MSEDVRKHIRTQGKYSDTSFHSDDRGNKSRDKKQKVSLGAKETSENKVHKRNSYDNKGAYNSSVDEGISPIKYEENSDFSFRQLDDVKKPIEIVDPGKHVLSTTENGESVILFNPDFINEPEANNYFDNLNQGANWHAKNIVINGVEYPQPRLVAWYGPFSYSYSGATLEPEEMPTDVLEIKQKVEEFLKRKGIEVKFNSVLLNKYRNGKDSVAWHSDDELTMGICPTIASVSLGETRKFEMRRKIKNYEEENSSQQMDEYLVHLTHGSLIIMTGCMQDDWQHRVPKEYHDKYPRINLTFRTVYPLKRIPDDETKPAKETKKELIANNSSTKTRNSEFILDDVNFPPLSSDISPEDFPPSSSDISQTCPDIENNVHEKVQDPSSYFKKDDNASSSEIWDIEISDSKQNVHHSVINDYHYESICANSSDKYEDSVIENNRSLNSVQSHIKASVGLPTKVPQKNNLDNRETQNNDDEKDSPLGFHSHETNSAVNDGQENNLNKEETPRRWHSIGPNSSVNNFSKKDPLKKVCTNKAISGINGTRVNNFSKKEPPRRRHNVDANPSANDNQSVSNKNFSIEEANPTTTDTQGNYVSKKESSMKCYNITDNSPINVSQNNLDKKDSKTCHHEPSSPVNIAQEKDLDNKVPTKTGLNVEAKEFVPINTIYEINQYSQFDLEDLMHYEINLFQGKKLQELAYTLRDKVSERLHSFNRFQREELEFLCKLTDGSQTEKNQRLISTRLCNTVINSIERRPSSDGRRSFDGNARQHGYVSHSHFSDRGRRFQNQGRGNNYRY